MGDLWTVLKAVVELGALGVLLALMVMIWMRTNKELKESMRDRLVDEKEHKKELLRQQTDYNQALSSLIRQQDETLNGLNTVLERVEARLEE